MSIPSELLRYLCGLKLSSLSLVNVLRQEKREIGLLKTMVCDMLFSLPSQSSPLGSLSCNINGYRDSNGKNVHHLAYDDSRCRRSALNGHSCFYPSAIDRLELARDKDQLNRRLSDMNGPCDKEHEEEIAKAELDI